MEIFRWMCNLGRIAEGIWWIFCLFNLLTFARGLIGFFFFSRWYRDDRVLRNHDVVIRAGCKVLIIFHCTAHKTRKLGIYCTRESLTTTNVKSILKIAHRYDGVRFNTFLVCARSPFIFKLRLCFCSWSLASYFENFDRNVIWEDTTAEVDVRGVLFSVVLWWGSFSVNSTRSCISMSSSFLILGVCKLNLSGCFYSKSFERLNFCLKIYCHWWIQDGDFWFLDL